MIASPHTCRQLAACDDCPHRSCLCVFVYLLVCICFFSFFGASRCVGMSGLVGELRAQLHAPACSSPLTCSYVPPAEWGGHERACFEAYGFNSQSPTPLFTRFLPPFVPLPCPLRESLNFSSSPLSLSLFSTTHPLPFTLPCHPDDS
jgi:hypothetical protein